MGCAICLDDFEQSEHESKRATALACGHIFHQDCLQTWFYGPTSAATHRAHHQKRCPLCTKPATPDSMIKLYPSDGNDLDIYLSSQHTWEFVKDPGVEPTDTKNLKQLLDDLMDFSSAVQAYVMAVHRCDLQKTIKAGAQIRKLVINLTKDREIDLKDTLMNSMDALENAASCFNTMFNDLARRHRKYKQMQLDVERQKEQAVEELKTAQNTEATARNKLREAQVKEKAVNERLLRAQNLETSAADMTVAVQRREQELSSREQQLQAKMHKMKLETKLEIANITSTTDIALKKLQIELDVARKKSADAEKERVATHKKNCELADQLKKLQQQFKDRKKMASPGPSKPILGENEATARRLKALEARNKSLEEQLKATGISTPDHRISRNSRRFTSEVIDMRSSSPLGHDSDSAPVTPLDGFELDSQASSSTTAASRLSPMAQRKGRKRARSILSVEPERLDDEMDEDLYPMPGFGVLDFGGKSAATATSSKHPSSSSPAAQRPKTAITFSSSTSKPSSSSTPSKGPLLSRVAPQTTATKPPASTTSERKSPARKGANASTSSNNDSIGTKRKRASTPSTTSSANVKSKTNNETNYDWINKSLIALGPKRRSKA